MATPSTSRNAVKSEPGTVPSRRSRAQLDESDPDEADPDQPTQATKRRRSETLEQTQATQNGGDDEDEVAPRSTVLLRDSTGYVTGSIVRVRVSNFVTYDSVEFRPGPALNMVLGPNGTGKSTIACAIALGLGFSPKVLGRSSKVSEFVKLGHDSGWIEIELKGKPDGKNYVIRRHLAHDSERTSYTLDGRDATAAQIHQTMLALNVQVSNLCTFLPQDRVSSFSQMAPNELLKETQRAAGDPRLIKWHDWLGESHQWQKQMKDELDRKESSLKGKKDKQAQQEKEVNQFQARKELQEQLDVLALLLPFAEYAKVRVEWQESKEVRNQAQQDLAQLERANQPFKTAQDALREKVKYYDRSRKTAVSKTDKTKKEITNHLREIDKLEEDTTRTRDALELVKKDDKDRKQTIQRLQREIEDAEKSLGERPDKADATELTNRIRGIGDQVIPITAQIVGTNQFAKEAEAEGHRLSRDERQVQQNLSRLTSVQGQREADCRRHSPDAWEGVQWLRQNKDKFHGKVFEPVRLQVQVAQQYKRFVDIAEGPITMATMNTFVFERQADYDLFMHEVADQAGKRVNGSELPPGKTLADFRHPFPDQFKEWGFDCWAIDLIEGPDLVLAYLCQREKLHLIPVCLDPNRQLNTQEIESSRKISRYYTPAGSNSIKYSSYGARVAIVEQRGLDRAKVFTTSIDQQAVDRYAQELKEIARQKADWSRRAAENAEMDGELHNRVDVLEREKATLQEEKDALQQPLRRWLMANTKLDSKRNMLRLEKAKPTAEAKTAELRHKLAKAATKGAKLALHHGKLVGKAVAYQALAHGEDLELVQAEADLRAMDHSSSAQDQALNAKQQELDEALARVAQLASKARELKKLTEDALNAASPVTSHKAQLVRENGDPELDDLRAQQEDLEAKLNCTVDVSHLVLEQYDRRAGEIAELTEEVERNREKYDELLESVRAHLDKWLPRLNVLIGQISERFTAALEHLGIRGEIGLDKSEADYDKWGIQIKVAFRDNEKVQILTSHRQSGGERALTTVMYIMSLAELAKAPFALVDEINQGMDQRVERQVHNALVRTTCKDDVGQYFLITPKLLSDLDYHEKMKILIINNGTWIPAKLSLQSIVDARLAKIGKGKGKGKGKAKVNGHGAVAVAAH